MLKVAILGYGVVGSAVAKTLLQNKEIIKARCGEYIEPVIALARTPKKNALIPITHNVDEILQREDIDIFVELMGGIETPFKIVSEILKKKKNVVTANKAMLAYYRYELESLAKNLAFGFEASVAGGIPIIKVLKEGLSANHILSLKGILNGTSNYILTNMSKKKQSFESVLKKAQELGYAEADPSFDIQGQDAAHKLLILASIAYGLKAKPEDILIQGISQISSEDIYFAKEFDYVIKLLGIAKDKNSKIELRVHPTMIPKEQMLAKVDGVMNAISVSGDMLGESLYYGAGAGGDATASAVVSDLMDIARGQLKASMLGFKDDLKYTLLEKDEIYTKYYLRIKVEDKIGVLSKITQLMSQNSISVDSFLQKPKAEEAFSTLFFTTHHTYEKNIQIFLDILAKQDFVKALPFMIRIEH
ncbi:MULTISPECIES: homoserine dehydrogenase [unclassified Campylobacter]|uniref:homoserine dehydrogenase n=1 Tax=unclassified Campylobacter TaxID=2593542 RepID=UPI001237F192|nr:MULTISPECIES: homoserine dehydrogenase [unclassified Campylobacter]KAA6225214.1 homoserine dehydrogenase [Campylobacter sp. LR196d]KAA6226225.1 homoserine dehydrogenase [Campylobacter sp. LR185c]KAA6228974.1 homoserine dehydrogenase [Campylobacter sp. LR286c]KAA6231427.1 homoserine dehydrogenase [Campylobacter sp. LR264d]KAA6231639.1 homoserine dehydrogenase [Campylobacter sp. LR291e]